LDTSGSPIRPINGGTVLSFFGGERKENVGGEGPAVLADAPLAFMDPVHDATCSCTYPRCFDGTLESDKQLTQANGETPLLHDWLGETSEFAVTISQKLRECCEFKTKMYISYAEQECGANAVNTICQTDPGYEARFANEAQGPDKHFPNSICISTAWAKFATMSVADKRTFADTVNGEGAVLLETGTNTTVDNLLSLLSGSVRARGVRDSWCNADANGIIADDAGNIIKIINCATDCSATTGCSQSNHEHWNCCAKHCNCANAAQSMTENDLSSLMETGNNNGASATVGWDCG